MKMAQNLGLGLAPSSLALPQIKLYLEINVLLMAILVSVILLSMFLLSSENSFKTLTSNQSLETFFIGLPLFLLLCVGSHSLALVFGNENKSLNSVLTIKIVGNQWYWSYQVGSTNSFDSFMVSEEDLPLGSTRLLETDNRLILPVGSPLRLLLTSSDVIHAWALPSFLLKVDCMGGLLNSLLFTFESVGLFEGQCSEICGANHSYMPIQVEVTLFGFFLSWLGLL